MANSESEGKGLRAAIIPVTPFQQNCTLIWDDASKVGAVVDPGGDLDQIKAAIAELGIKVEKILLTHGHIDHAGGADELRQAGYGEITTEVAPAREFYYAEPYHQQYLAANPNGYCGLGGTGLSCPVGVGTVE